MLSAAGRPSVPRGVVVAVVVALALHVLGTLALSGSGWVGRTGASRLASGQGSLIESDAVAHASSLRVRLASAPARNAAAPSPANNEGAPSEPGALPGGDAAQQLLNQAPPAAGGSAAFASTYLPADEVDQGPVPEPGWILDEGALEQVGRARMRLRLWVSDGGRIDRVAVLHAEPSGAWVDRAIAPLPDTRMRPAERGGRPVPSTIVVELTADLESMR